MTKGEGPDLQCFAIAIARKEKLYMSWRLSVLKIVSNMSYDCLSKYLAGLRNCLVMQCQRRWKLMQAHIYKNLYMFCKPVFSLPYSWYSGTCEKGDASVEGLTHPMSDRKIRVKASGGEQGGILDRKLLVYWGTAKCLSLMTIYLLHSFTHFTTLS